MWIRIWCEYFGNAYQKMKGNWKKLWGLVLSIKSMFCYSLYNLLLNQNKWRKKYSFPPNSISLMFWILSRKPNLRAKTLIDLWMMKNKTMWVRSPGWRELRLLIVSIVNSYQKMKRFFLRFMLIFRKTPIEDK